MREWAAISISRGSSGSGIERRSPALQADSLPTELQRESMYDDLNDVSVVDIINIKCSKGSRLQ